jgi:hypothetical protein
MDEVYELFTKHLKRRFEIENNDVKINEIIIEYTFLDSINSTRNILPENVNIDFPLGNQENNDILADNKRMDLFITNLNEKHIIAEFKFHRKKKPPKTRNAGQVFADVIKLYKFRIRDKNIKRLFIYVYDKVMDEYYRKKINEFSIINVGNLFPIDRNYLENRPETFKKEIKRVTNYNDLPEVNFIKLKCVCSSHLPNFNFLKIFEVIPLI